MKRNKNVSTELDFTIVETDDIAKIKTRLTALEAEVKRLASRKVCQECKGLGLYAHIENGLHGCVENCCVCNGTGYIESEENNV